METNGEVAIYKTIPCYSCGEPHSVGSYAFFQCRKCGAPNYVSDWWSRMTDEEARKMSQDEEERKRGLGEKVRPIFLAKYEELKRVCPDIGPFDSAPIYQNPDRGWQQVFLGHAAITLHPENITYSYEVHEEAEACYVCGLVFHRWIEEGGTYNEEKLQGRLGYPREDTSIDYGDSTESQEFDRGIIRKLASGETEIAMFSQYPRTLLGAILGPLGELNYGTPWIPKYRGSWGERRITQRWMPTTRQ